MFISSGTYLHKCAVVVRQLPRGLAASCVFEAVVWNWLNTLFRIPCSIVFAFLLCTSAMCHFLLTASVYVHAALLGGQANVLPVSAAQFTRAVDTVKVSCWAVVLQRVCGMWCHSVMNGCVVV